MAAPDGIKWGSIYGSGTHRGRLGIYVNITHTNTQTIRNVQVWFWSEYTCYDTSNTFYYDCKQNITSASTSKGAVVINCTSSSQWSTSNQKKLAEYDYTYDKGTSAKTYQIYAKLSGIEYVGETIYANTSFVVPELASYTVSYNANGGTGAPSSQKKWYGTNITLSTTKPTRTGYVFLGWGTSSSDTTVDYSSGASYTENASVTLYAIWSRNKLTVNYYSNYATSSFDGALNEVGKDKNVLVSTQEYGYDVDCSTYGLRNYSNSSGSAYLARIGYTATKNWGTSVSGGTLVNEDTGFATGQAIAKTFGKDISNGNASVNVYAQWTPNTYTITYNGNGGLWNSTDTWSENVTYDTNYITEENFFLREGYTFTGWNEKADGSGTDWTSSIGKPWNWTYTKNVTLYAQWKENTYTITYNGNGGLYNGNITWSENVVYNSSYITEENFFARTGYTFAGWNEKADGSGTDWTNNIGIPWTWTYAKDVTLYAQWTPNKYIVTYDGNGGLYNGNATWSDTATYGVDYTTYDNFFKREGYSFIGWNESQDGSGVSWTNNINKPWNWTYTRDVTLYAQWKESGIVYIDNGIVLEPYLVYIDNGTNWDLYLPYIDNGTSWDILS